MQSIWTAGLDEVTSRRIKSEFEGSRFLLDRLIKILEIKGEDSLNSIRSKGIYDKPNWEMFVADQLAYQRSLKELINLIKE